MNALVFLLVLVPCVFTGPARPVNRLLPEKLGPDVIYVENSKGELELVDLTVRPEGKISPRVELTDVQYDLYTRNNRESAYLITGGSVEALKPTTFDPSRLTMFVIHGWNNNRNSAVNTVIKDAVFINYDVNLFIVDWSGPANEFYLEAKDAVVPVGQYVGAFINSIMNTYGLGGSAFVLVGHSLGAHVAGAAGAVTQVALDQIVGLDPAGPLYLADQLDQRLDTTDAKFVQIIHADGSLLGVGISMGHVDFYPNGGMSQPGCGIDLAGTCSHGKAYRYFAENLSRGPVFHAHLCTSYDNFLAGMCSNNAEADMGQIELASWTHGDYYLVTNDDEPYGQG